MIDQITFRSEDTGNGKVIARARIWIGGIPFSADLSPQVEAVVRRVAYDVGVNVLDDRGRAA